MNCDTGHLVDSVMLAKMEDLQRQQYEVVPAELAFAANRVLAGRPEAHVSLTSGGKLSKFAAGNRKQRRLMAKQSRRANR